MVLLFFFLHLHPTKHDKTFRQHVEEFDFIGLLLIIAGIGCVLVGFSESQNGCECIDVSYVRRCTAHSMS